MLLRNFGLGRTQMEEKIVHYINYMIAHIDSKMEGKKVGTAPFIYYLLY